MNTGVVEVSIVMPCLNEEETIGICIQKAQRSLKQLGIIGEIVIADNGSTDRSVEIAKSFGARIVYQPLKGYGNTLQKGIEEANGKYIIMGDADDSYDFSKIDGFIHKLREGYDVVMGSRFRGEIKKGAMPFLHRLFGNPFLTGLLNLFFKAGISDAQCGLRAFTKEAYNRMQPKTSGMEFASEFVVKAAKERLKITEIPITLYKDGRSHPPHLRTFSDGWRYLRFLLMYSPTYLYLIPGTIIFVLGMILELVLYSGPLQLGNFALDVHFNILGCVLTIMGFQIITLGLFSRIYVYVKGFDKYDNFIKKFLVFFELEKGIGFGLVFVLIGLGFFIDILVEWGMEGFKGIFEIRKGLLATTLMVVGFEAILSSFFISMLAIEEKEKST